MFDLGEFIKKTLKGMIGSYPDFQVREYAINWYAKGKLTEEDLATVDGWIEEHNAAKETEEAQAEEFQDIQSEESVDTQETETE